MGNIEQGGAALEINLVKRAHDVLDWIPPNWRPASVVLALGVAVLCGVLAKGLWRKLRERDSEPPYLFG